MKQRRHVRSLSVSLVVAAAASGLTLAGAGWTPATAGAPRLAASAPRAGSASSRVIVVLRDQHRADGVRSQAVAADQTRLAGDVAELGGSTTRHYRSVNAMAATLPTSSLAALRADDQVSAVYPDLAWHLQRPGAGTADATGAGASAPAPASASVTRTGPICPADPDHPLLEPEPLGQTHTDSDDPSEPTARSLGYDGTGVKVGFIADGLDVDQPDFIRADGTHVITDYRDFSGEGTESATSGAEAFLDGSSIAAQGRTAYDISDFVNTAHPLPPGCTIRVEGMAPGASMVAMKIFSTALVTAPTSTIIQAIDWAVSTDHVDVLNESFGSNPYPDDASDPISLFNKAAVEQGVTVVASAGDAGSGNTLGTASTDPWVISAAASTSEQTYAQQTLYGFQLGNGEYTSDGLSSLSSGGISQLGGVPDLTAPGDLNWTVCSDALLPDGTPQYVDCVDNNFQPSDLQTSGGTSESAPLVAGAAALVIQAYREAHGGASPTPDLVRRILDSTADDAGLPAPDQGAGLLNSYRAVRMAADVDAPSGPTSDSGLLLDQHAASLTAGPDEPVHTTFTVTNPGAAVRQVHAALRTVDDLVGTEQQRLVLSRRSPQTFVDGYGRTRSYTTTPFTVPAGTDRLDVTDFLRGAPDHYVRIVLFDPDGAFAGFSQPQGPGNVGRVRIADPQSGQWTAIVWSAASALGYNGPVQLQEDFYRQRSAGTVSPADLTLAPGASRTVRVDTTTPDAASRAATLTLTSSASGLAPVTETTQASVVTTAVTRVARGSGTRIDGQFTTGDGRDYAPSESETYVLQVPAHAAALNVRLDLGGTAPAARGNTVYAHLSDPSGEPIATVANQHANADVTSLLTDGGLELLHADPAPGRWQLTVELPNPARRLPLRYSVTASLNPARVSTTGVPTSPRQRISRGAVDRERLTLTNTGPAAQTYAVDPRTDDVERLPLVVAQSPSGTDPFTATADLPLVTEQVPGWLTPTQTSAITVDSHSSAPLTFDLMPLEFPTAVNAPSNPDTESDSGVDTTVTHAATPVASVLWGAFPTLIGPSPAAGEPPATDEMTATATTRGFYRGYRTSTGDPMLATVDPSSPIATPITLQPGETATITLRLTPTGAVGDVERGTLDVVTLPYGGPAGVAGFADVAASIPFAFTVAR